MPSKGENNNRMVKALAEYSERVTSEIKREHHQRLSWDDSLDLKCGVILGFVMLILVQIILSGELTASLASNITILASFISANAVSNVGSHFWLSLISLMTFLIAFVCLLYAAIAGFRVISLRAYADVKIDDSERDCFDKYRTGKLSAADVDSKLTDKLLVAMSANEKNAEKKARGIENMLKSFSWGVAFLVGHFLATLLSTLVSS